MAGFDYKCQCLPHRTICTCLTDIHSGDKVVIFTSINRLVFRHVLQRVEMCMSCFFCMLCETLIPHCHIFRRILLFPHMPSASGTVSSPPGVTCTTLEYSSIFSLRNHTPLFFFSRVSDVAAFRDSRYGWPRLNPRTFLMPQLHFLVCYECRAQ